MINIFNEIKTIPMELAYKYYILIFFFRKHNIFCDEIELQIFYHLKVN